MRLLTLLTIVSVPLLPRGAAAQAAASGVVQVVATVLPAAPALDVQPLRVDASHAELRWQLDGATSQHVSATLDSPLPRGMTLAVERRGSSGVLALRVVKSGLVGEVRRTLTLTVTSMN